MDLFTTSRSATVRADPRLSPPLDGANTLALLREHVRRERPSVIHLLDWHADLSPSAYQVAREYKLPLVQSAPNFQQHCLNGTYFRNNRPCEDCKGHGRLRGVVRACNQDSIRASAQLAARLAFHDRIGDFSRTTTLYLASTFHARQKLIDGGVPLDKVIVHPPYVDIPLPHDAPRSNGLFVGPLSNVSGFVTLMQAALQLANVIIDVAGEGDDRILAEEIPTINLLPPMDANALADRMMRAAFLIYPAQSYTEFPDTVIQAFGARLPVIASATGGIDEIVEAGQTGLLFTPGDAKDLARKIHWVGTHPEAMLEMGRNARRTYQERSSSMRGVRRLIDAYELAQQLAHGPLLGTAGAATENLK